MSTVCPIVVPLTITLSTVNVVSVPTEVRLGIAVISSSKYAAKSVTATCFIVPSSLNTTLSASATVVDEALVSPSKILSSSVVTVAPSRISNSASEIPADPIVTVPANVTLAPLNVIAVVGVDPDLITSSPLLFVKEAKVALPFLRVMSSPSASRIISPVASIVRLLELAIVRFVPSPSIFSPSSPNVKPTLAGILMSVVAVRFMSLPEANVKSVPSELIYSPPSS